MNPRPFKTKKAMFHPLTPEISLCAGFSARVGCSTSVCAPAFSLLCDAGITQCGAHLAHLRAETRCVVAGWILKLLEQAVDRGADVRTSAGLFFVAEKNSVESHRGLLSGARVLVGDALSLIGDRFQ